MAKSNIEVVYVSPVRQRMIKILLLLPATIEAAIHQSNICIEFPEIDLSRNKIGIFGKIKQLPDFVQVGDRIEIYRPLTIDPKEKRRLKSCK